VFDDAGRRSEEKVNHQMKMLNLLKCLPIVLGSFVCFPAYSAADFSVGRVAVRLPGDGWRAVDLKDAGINYSGEISGTIPSEKKIFIKESLAKELQIMVVVRASSSGISGGRVSYSSDCESTPDFVATGMDESDKNFYDCVRVFKLFTADSLMNLLTPDLKKILDQDAVVVPESLQTVWSKFANENGTFVDVIVFINPAFMGKKSEANKRRSSDIDASSYAWGQELAKEVKDAVNSVFSKLKIPELIFKSDSAPTQPTQ
jgi:hypothetical protein